VLASAPEGLSEQKRFWVSAAEPSTVYTSRSEFASDSGSSALAAIYRRAIERYEEQKKGGPETAPDDTRRDQDARIATKNYTD
jgi:hypothetical protein